MRVFLFVLMAALSACTEQVRSRQLLDADIDANDSSTNDAAIDVALDAVEDTARAPSLPPGSFDVAREMRGVWVATVAGLDFPSSSSLTATQQTAELQEIVNRSHQLGLNAIFFQSRIAADALYRSSIEPWSRVLTGTQGRDPGYDPLGKLIELAHAQGIEVHAWLNPYRGTSRTADVVTSNHITRVLAEDALTYNGIKVMDPSSTAVREWIVDVVLDISNHYDVDGIHFDDYFYPYPNDNNDPFPDDARYTTYRMSGATLSKSAWRRDNINRMVREVSRSLAREHPAVRFGISPFGIYRPNIPQGVVGLDAFNEIACDPLAWLRDESVDYLIPQLYWPITSTGQPFASLLTWWSTQTSRSRPVFAGHAAYRVGATAAWTAQELLAQVALTDDAPSLAGSVFFRYQNLLDGDIQRTLSARYSGMALPPAMPRGVTPTAPVVDVVGSQVRVVAPNPRALAILRISDRAVVHVGHYASITAAMLPSGDYVAVVINRFGWVSAPTTFQVRG